MRVLDTRQEGMFSYVSRESRIPRDHPLRPIREMVDDALKELSADFDVLYSHTGRPSIAPEKLIRALSPRRAPFPFAGTIEKVEFELK